MHRFFLPPGQCRGDRITLQDREAHHGLHVLRLRAGDDVVVLNGAGQEFRCRAAECSRREVQLTVESTIDHPALPARLTLLQAIPKGKTFENIVQKATELGVHRIVPLLTDRSEVHLDALQAASKLEKWQLVAVESIKQCGSPWLPIIEVPMTPREFLQRNETFSFSFVAALHPDARHPRSHFEAAGFGRGGPGAVWVGPEGDFTPEELKMIRASGAAPITLGPLILRSDTAAVYCLSILNYELGS